MVHPPLQILYLDGEIAVVNKPSGLIVHRGLGTDRVVVMTMLRDQLGGRHVYPVHRLDRGTSGALVFALSPEAAARYQDALSCGLTQKRYLALVRGRAPDAAHIDHPVPRCEKGERIDAVTDIRRLWTAKTEIGEFSLVEAFPRTGRFHQIRRHLKHLTHPLVGDTRYGRGEINRFFRERFGLCRIALHAASICFPNLSAEEAEDNSAAEDLCQNSAGKFLSSNASSKLLRKIEAPLPKDLAEVLHRLEETSDASSEIRGLFAPDDA